MALIDYRKLKPWCWALYLLSIVLLVAVFIIGVERYGAKRWLQIGPIRMQPSELAKTALVLTLAWIVSLRDFRVNRFSNLLLVGVLSGVPFLLILKEPDLGSALVLVPVTGLILFMAGLNWKWILTAILGAALLVPAVFPFLKDYQKERVYIFLNPERDVKNRGWNSLQSELAVGSGGMWGKGLMQGTQNTLGFLPQTVSNTDFIFSVIAEETGFVGAAGVVVLFALLIFSALRVCLLSEDPFGRCIATGIAGIFFIHCYVNIGMSIRLMPVTGLPLPLVSYGGSFIVNTLFFLGILQSIYAHRKNEMA
jgi:rod shape determining protein RodA